MKSIMQSHNNFGNEELDQRLQSLDKTKRCPNKPNNIMIM